MKSNWNYPTTVWTGENRIEDLSDVCKSLNIKNHLFVSDKDLIDLPMTQKVINKFKNLKIFSNFLGNPKKLNTEDMKIMYEHSILGKLFK